MSSTVKIILALVAVMFLGIVGVGVAGYMWIESNSEQLKQQGEAIKAEAEKYGREHNQNHCVGASLKKLDRCDGIICRAKVGVFLSHCLEHSQVVPGFCDSIPHSNDIMGTVTWSLKVCTDVGRAGDQPCARLMRSMQKHCDGEDEAKPVVE